MKPVAWIKIRELSYMKAVAEHGKDDWRTNLGLKPEPDDEGLYTETQVQQLRESFEQSVTDPENQPSQYGTVPLDWHLRDEALLRQALEFFEHTAVKHPSQIAPRDDLVAALKERLK
jgi:hypothetical protein|nr:MAG TPA: hypothetical protein [Caudoviricetes sp.]